MSIYHSITEWSSTEWCCDERMAICPECGGEVCVFCHDFCDFCLTPVW